MKNQFVRRLSALLADAIRECTQEQTAVDPDRVAEAVASQLWADLARNTHGTDADWVRSIRTQGGLTQAALAEALGTSQVTVARWESGTRKVSKVYRRLLEALAAQETPAMASREMTPDLTVSAIRQPPLPRGPRRSPLPRKPTKSTRVTFDMDLTRNYGGLGGSKREARMAIEEELREFGMVKPDPKRDEYILTIPYETEEELDKIVLKLMLAVDSAASLYDYDTHVEAMSLDDPEREWP